MPRVISEFMLNFQKMFLPRGLGELKQGGLFGSPSGSSYIKKIMQKFNTVQNILKCTRILT